MNPSLPLLAALLLAAPAAALEWNSLGARALGMGGAGVAVPQGPADNYWNPANLGAPDSKHGGVLPAAFHYGITGSILEGANDLDELAQRPAAEITQAEVDAALGKFAERGSGVRGDVGGGLQLKIGRWAAFFNGFGYLGAIPQPDLVNTTPAAIANETNNSKLIVRGAQIAELGVGHGRELPFAEGVYLGANLKLMQAKVGYADAFILREDQEWKDLIDDMKDGAETSGNVGVDLAAMWDLERSFGAMPLRPRVALVGRNLNNPTFSQPAAATAAGYVDDFAVNPQVRLGGSISPFPWWNVASDLDMTENTTPVPGVKSRQWSLGSEFNLINRTALNVPLRVGLLRNLADGRSGTMLTLGAGINVAHFHAELSAALSPKKVRTQSEGGNEETPREAAIGFSIGLLFGGERPEVERPTLSPRPDDPPASTERVRESMERSQRELDREAEKRR